MIKKHQKKICTGIFFILFLFIGFFYLSIHRISALEVDYPTIGGQTFMRGSPMPELPEYVLYVFNAGMFLGFFAAFISLLIAGVMYFLSPIKADLISAARDRISGAISGILILALTYLIVTTINPQLSILNFNKPPPTQPLPATKKAPGVYFYNGTSCPDAESPQSNTSNVSDLGPLKNRLNSACIVKDADTQTAYISILYANSNLWGKCMYLDPDQDCQSQGCQSADDPQTGSPFASSASVYPYNFHPNGDGVYFYRRSYFNPAGGYLPVLQGQIGGLYIRKLEDLKFQNVPEPEQDCTKYDKIGQCTQNGRKPPSLSGESISSIKISPPGDYLVLLTYAGPGQSCSTSPWTSCQEFPTPDDVNKTGPLQIKWQNIRNGGGVIPNCLIIIPIRKD